MKISERLDGKSVLIWGYGREGKSTERFLNRFCHVKSCEIYEGPEDGKDFSRYDFVIKSPGIRTERCPENFTSQTELFLSEFAPQTIGITGTKGKSTTASLLYSTLSACLERNVLLVGNIGLPCLDYYGSIDADTVVVFEMSCHQLCHLRLSPHIAVFLNLYEDHLDYYGTRERYFEAKRNITAHQSAEDLLLVGSEVPPLSTAARTRVIGPERPDAFALQLRGSHNQFNARFVYTICTELFGCDGAAVRESMAGFSGLSHRMQFVRTVNGVSYYNDSISTIPEATIAAIRSIENVKTVLIGGLDRGIHYGVLVDFIRQHPAYNYILCYASGARIYREVAELSCCRYTETLEDALRLAQELTPPGGACLLSPAAASYGYFKNFEDRGNAFMALVNAIEERQAGAEARHD